MNSTLQSEKLFRKRCINSDNVAEAAGKRWEDNHFFRTWLKHSPDAPSPRAIQGLVTSLQSKYFQLIDCTACGNCCGVEIPIGRSGFPKNRLVSIARSVDLSVKELQQRYVKTSDEGCYMQPCAALEDKKCRIYSERPKLCRDFPALDKDFLGRSLDIIGKSSFCPIIYEVLEKLKKILNWKDYRDGWQEYERNL